VLGACLRERQKVKWTNSQDTSV